MYFLNWIVTAAILTFPVLSLTVHNAGNGSLFLLLMCAAGIGVRGIRPMNFQFSDFLKEYWPLHVAMAATVGAVIFQQLSTGHFEAKHFDRPLRLLVFPAVLWVALLLPLQRLRLFQWSLMAGVVLAAAKAYVFTKGGNIRPNNIGFMHIIAYSDITLLMGTMSVISVSWQSTWKNWLTLAKVMIFAVGVYVTIITSTRGSWVAIPAILAFFFFYFVKARASKRVLLLIPCAILLSAVFLNSANVTKRFNAAISNITSYEQGTNVDTSVGMRFQMWRAAWRIFEAHPVFGVGRENYSSDIKELSAQGVLSRAAAHYAHPHNELLFNMAISGIFGLLATLALYLVPGGYFFRQLASSDPQIRATGGMGVMLCLCFFIFGLTDVMFFWTVLDSFYTMSIAVFVAFIIKRKQELAVVPASSADIGLQCVRACGA